MAAKLLGRENFYGASSRSHYGRQRGRRRVVYGADEAVVDALPQSVTAERVSNTLGGWMKGEDGNCTRVYAIDCPQGHFDLVRLKRARFALRQGDTVLGIAAMPLPSGLFSRLKSRIELPASLPLSTLLFLAMLVEIEDIGRLGTSSP